MVDLTTLKISKVSDEVIKHYGGLNHSIVEKLNINVFDMKEWLYDLGVEFFGDNGQEDNIRYYYPCNGSGQVFRDCRGHRDNKDLHYVIRVSWYDTYDTDKHRLQNLKFEIGVLKKGDFDILVSDVMMRLCETDFMDTLLKLYTLVCYIMDIAYNNIDKELYEFGHYDPDQEVDYEPMNLSFPPTEEELERFGGND